MESAVGRLTYLDTHVVVWLYFGNLKKLSREAARSIERADQLLVSPMVELELDLLFRIGRNSVTSGDLLADLRGRIGLSLCELPFSMVSHAALSTAWTRDLFDRIIVAQAAATESPLITSDELILTHYSKAVW